MMNSRTALQTASSPSEQAPPCCGGDVDKETFVAALYVFPQPGVPDFKKMPAVRFERNAQGVTVFLNWVDNELAQQRPGSPTPRFCMESTGIYAIELATEILRQRPEMAPAIVNARYIKKFGESLGLRCYSDKPDARTCAVYGADRLPEPWMPPQYRKLQELARERQALVSERTELANRCGSTLAETKLVLRIRKQLDQQLQNHIEKLDQDIEKEIKSIPELKTDADKVDEIPGVGKTTIAIVFAECGDLRSYSRGRSLTAMVGLNPKYKESGPHKGKTRISKQGKARPRGILYCAAMAALKTKDDHCLKRFYCRLLDNGKTKKQAHVAVARKILLLMRSLLISGESFDPDYDQRENVKKRSGNGELNMKRKT